MEIFPLLNEDTEAHIFYVTNFTMQGMEEHGAKTQSLKNGEAYSINYYYLHSDAEANAQFRQETYLGAWPWEKAALSSRAHQLQSMLSLMQNASTHSNS